MIYLNPLPKKYFLRLNSDSSSIGELRIFQEYGTIITPLIAIIIALIAKWRTQLEVFGVIIAISAVLIAIIVGLITIIVALIAKWETQLEVFGVIIAISMTIIVSKIGFIT